MYSTANNTWFNGLSEHDHSLQQQQQPSQQQQQQQHSSSSPTILTTYHLNAGEMLSTTTATTLDPYRVANDNTGSTNSFYMSYPNAVGDSEQDDQDDLEETDDDDDEDSLYQLPKRHTNHSATATNKNGTPRRTSRPNGSKRKRVLNGVQRAEATQREKRRMLKLNRAFEDLRKVLPVTEFARNKLSRSETLKSAIDYINLMFSMLNSAKGHHHPHHHDHYQQ